MARPLLCLSGMNTTKQTLAARILRTSTLFGAALVATSIVGSLSASATEPAPRLDAPAAAEQTVETQQDLPREWRWSKKAVSFDGMYRSR